MATSWVFTWTIWEDEPVRPSKVVAVLGRVVGVGRIPVEHGEAGVGRPVTETPGHRLDADVHRVEGEAEELDGIEYRRIERRDTEVGHRRRCHVESKRHGDDAPERGAPAGLDAM